MSQPKGFFKNWLCEKRSYFFSCLFIISFSTFILYVMGVPLSQLLYCVVLLVVMILFCGAIMYWSSLQKFQYFQRLLQQKAWNDPVGTPTEQLLLASIKEERQQLEQLTETYEQKQFEQLDYYTMWGHQIKTPISSTLLLIDQLEDQSTKILLKQELFKVQQYADAVLYYLRMSSFHQDLVLQNESIEELVKTSVKKFSLFFIHQGITLELSHLDGTVITDKKWLAVVLEQLLSNALKYTVTGSIRIYMKAGILHIQDTGIGIKENDLHRVFERGYSGYNGRVTMQSTGLGLYLVKEILQKLGHTIRIESEFGKGTLVKIDLNQTKIQSI